MARKKPEIQLPTKRRRTKPDEAKIRALEARQDKLHQQTSEALAEPASPRAPKPRTKSEHSGSASEEREVVAKAAGGAGTTSSPYMRARDGKATRGTTIVFEVTLHEQLRLYAFQNRRSQSDVVAQALSEFFERNA